VLLQSGRLSQLPPKPPAMHDGLAHRLAKWTSGAPLKMALFVAADLKGDAAAAPRRRPKPGIEHEETPCLRGGPRLRRADSTSNVRAIDSAAFSALAFSMNAAGAAR